MKRLLTLLNCFVLNLVAFNVGLCVVATGKYDVYAQGMIESARKYFCKGHKVTFFVFTDGCAVKDAPDVVKVRQKRLGWPYDTMMRFSVYLAHKDVFDSMDYIFATDADMLFVDYTEDIIFSDRVGTLHPGYVGTKGTYENQNKKSTAYIAPHEGNYYFAGGFYGGEKEEFIKLLQTVVKNIDKDLQNNFIAIWHDESHLNRYFIDNPPTQILSPSYCYVAYPQTKKYKKILQALDKNHAELRR